MSTGLKIFGFLILAGIIALILSLTFGTCNTAVKMVEDGQQTVYGQYKPSALLKKYEWFKDASAALDNKVATLGTYESRFKTVKSDYGSDSSNRAKWSRDDREQWNIWQSEYLGLKASYNDLAGQYNSDMAKFNYRFCNKGQLPAGAEVPLPREYKPYITQ